MIKNLAFFMLCSLPWVSQAHSGHTHGESHQHVHAEQAPVTLTHATIRDFLPAAKSTAGYFTLSNTTKQAMTLVKAEIEGLGRVEIHEHVHANGMMRMQQIDKLEIASDSQVEFKPGGYHLMAFEPTKPLKVGENRKLTLYFADGNRVYGLIEVISLKTQMHNANNGHQHH
ncbi:copper chaperone [Pseudoalteromonas rubra]|uniref:Copper chaperone n=1 Tax=Pseudoalteromonas rubra TaxID=43658 RepID=A0A5S3WRE4_9GAMM|nr:copper chaperone PCu(A)C [Pseudoalteromonas rubra]TMP31535.1 copper chaperone [Pseudoalteromonas rubra]TMP34619.1 copper chaperone [Pseudoalteromonas rubra]